MGDYWEDVDCYVRNHLIEFQLTDRDSLAASHRGRWTGPLPTTTPSPTATTPMRFDRVIGTLHGRCHAPHDDPPNLGGFDDLRARQRHRGHLPGLGGDRALHDGHAQVNLLLNRASPWLDVDSYLPYEGKVVIHNKTAQEPVGAHPAVG